MKYRSTEQTETRKRERGSILATSAIGMLSILLAVGLGVDISRFYLAKTELQNAADAAALAAVSALNTSALGITKAADRAVASMNNYDFNNGIRFNGFVIPALRTRRAKTGVELRDGQSFALAGLLDNSESKTLSRIPIVSEIPIIGNLFKSKSFEKKETELMFFVTAHMVKPVSPDDLPNMRGIDGLKGASPLGLEPKGEGVQGQSGDKISGQSEQTPAAAPAKRPAWRRP